MQIAGGQPLVDANDYNTLSYTARSTSEKVNQTDVDGLYEIHWSNGNEFNLTNAAMKGKLKGLVELRDGNNGTNFEGKVKSVTDGGTKVTIEVTANDLKDMKTCTLSDTGGHINIANTIYDYTSWVYNNDGTYTFTLKASPDTGLPTAQAAGKEAKTSESIIRGFPIIWHR